MVRAEELLDARATVNQSFQMVMHLTLYYGQGDIPSRPAAWIRGGHWLAVALLTAMLLWRHGRPAAWDGPHLLSVTALLSVLMVLASPVCHLHYFTMVLPLTFAVGAALFEGRVPWSWVVAPVLVLVGNTTFMLPPLASLRDLGLPMYATMALWLTGWWVLVQTPRQGSTAPSMIRQAA